MVGRCRYRTGRHDECLSLPLDGQRERPPSKAASNFFTKPDRTAAVRRSQDAGFVSWEEWRAICACMILVAWAPEKAGSHWTFPARTT